jgi:hypothetical protein
LGPAFRSFRPYSKRGDCQRHFRICCGAGNLALQPPFQAAFAVQTLSPRPRKRQLKAGGSQDWLPHNFFGIPSPGKTKWQPVGDARLSAGFRIQPMGRKLARPLRWAAGRAHGHTFFHCSDGIPQPPAADVSAVVETVREL